jgi:hypothetical protein
VRGRHPDGFDPGDRKPGTVVEDERTVEPTSGDESVDRTTEDEHPLHDERTPDDAAETFLELDDDLELRAESGATGGPRRGLVVDADRVDAGSVPAGYPLSATTDRAVALTVDFGGETTTVYLAWPDDASGETALTRLLDAMDIELRDLYGTTVLVERADGHDVLVTPDERPRGSDLRTGVVGGLGVVAGTVGLLAVTGGLPPVAYLVWLGVTLGWLPYATYRDAWYARTHSDWAGGPAFWATLMFLPFLNLLTGAAYLWSRSRATFFRERRSLLDRVASTVRDWL